MTRPTLTRPVETLSTSVPAAICRRPTAGGERCEGPMRPHLPTPATEHTVTVQCERCGALATITHHRDEDQR